MKLFSISAPYTRSLIPGYPSKEDFISLMKEYFSREALLFSSAKTALYILLRVLHRRSPEKNEVIIPAYTDAGLVSVLRRNGLKIVLADINLKDYGYDIEDLQKRINEKTLAVILVHLFGITQAPETLSSLDLKEKGIYLIEDFAQGFGGYLGNNRLGTLCDFSFTSFGRGKNLSLGTGGLLLFKSGMWSYALEDELKRLPSPPFYAPFADLLRYQLIHFFSRPGNYGFFNPLLGFFKASSPPLSFPLRKPSGRVARMGGGLFHEVLRSQLRVVYNQNFIYQSLRNIEGIGLFEPPAESRPVLTRFPVLFNKRAERLKAQRALKRAGFDSSAFYIKPVHHHFPDLGHSMSDFPKACYLASHLLTIPVHHQLAKDDLLKMVKIIKEVISDQEQVERGE